MQVDKRKGRWADSPATRKVYEAMSGLEDAAIRARLAARAAADASLDPHCEIAAARHALAAQKCVEEAKEHYPRLVEGLEASRVCQDTRQGKEFFVLCKQYVEMGKLEYKAVLFWASMAAEVGGLR